MDGNGNCTHFGYCPVRAEEAHSLAGLFRLRVERSPEREAYRQFDRTAPRPQPPLARNPSARPRPGKPTCATA
ncbi:MAG: hypothetical protein AB1768_15120 [Pseudomonadota bacterium]